MKQLEIVDSFGDTIAVEPELGLYTAYDFMGNKMPNLGIQFYSYDEDGFREPYATLTVNFGEFIGVKDCAYIDTNNNAFTGQLLTMGFCQDTGFTKQSGFCTYPLWKFDSEFLKAIDPEGLYEVYEKKFDEYMMGGPQAPLEDREMEVVSEVLDALGVAFEMDADSVGMTVWANDTVYYGAEIYRYLLDEVCEYEQNGAVKQLELDLCNDFYDLCEMNEVDYRDYIQKHKVAETEFVITMSSGGGTVLDFMTLPTRKEADQVCESYGWEFKDENDFVWGLDIDEREISLDDKLASAQEQSEKSAPRVVDKSDIVKEQ